MTFKEISEGYKKNAKMRAELGSKLVLHNSPDFTGIKSVQLKSQEVAKGVQEVLSSYKNQLDILKEGTSISELSVLYNNSLNKVASNFVNALSEVSKSWMGLAAAHSVPNGFIEALNESSRKLPGAVLNLADNGWYISRDITPGEVIHLSDLLEIGNFVEVHEYLIRHSESDLEDTISLLTRRHPDRKAIFDEISACYKHKLYYSAIPTILIQVDGICADFTNKKFFLRDSKKGQNGFPQVSNHISGLTLKKTDWYIAPIMKKPTIMFSDDEMANIPLELNRHRILHGVDVKYGNKVNFFKSLSLLLYMSDLLVEIYRNE